MSADWKIHKDLTPVQHPMILLSAVPEAIGQLLFLGGIVAGLIWLEVRFELTLLVLLVLGFTLNTMNMIAGNVGRNIHLAEIRDLLLEQNGKSVD